MKCKKCNNKATRYFDHSHWLCDRCFSKLIETRIRRGIKRLGIKVNDRVYPSDDFSRYIAGRFIKFPVRIMGKKVRGCVELVSSCIEEEIVKRLDYLCHNHKPSSSNRKLLFTDITCSDLRHYAKLHKIRFKGELKGELFKFVERISKKHPGIKNSFMRSVGEMKDMLQI